MTIKPKYIRRWQHLNVRSVVLVSLSLSHRVAISTDIYHVNLLSHGLIPKQCYDTLFYHNKL